MDSSIMADDISVKSVESMLLYYTWNGNVGLSSTKDWSSEAPLVLIELQKSSSW